MRAAVSSLQQRIITVERPEEGGKQRVVKARLRNQQDTKEWVGLAGFLGPMSDQAWRAFIKQRKAILKGEMDETAHS
jgi:hypothetical protein